MLPVAPGPAEAAGRTGIEGAAGDGAGRPQPEATEPLTAVEHPEATEPPEATASPEETEPSTATPQPEATEPRAARAHPEATEVGSAATADPERRPGEVRSESGRTGGGA